MSSTARAKAIGGVTAVVLALSAFSGAATSAAATREPIVIAALGPFFDAFTGTESTEWPAAVQARVAALNASGELGDYEVEVFVCDTGLDPNVTEQCARDAVAAGAVATVGFNGTTGGNLFPVLESAGLPVVGAVPSGPSELTSPMSFPLTSGVPGIFGALPMSLGLQGATTQALVLHDLGAASAIGQLFVEDSATRHGYTVAESIAMPLDQVDFAPVIASATRSDPAGISLFVIGEASATFIRQLRQTGYDGVVASASVFLTPAIVEALGDDAEGLQVPSLLSWQRSDGGQQYLAEMAQYAPEEAVSDLGANYWLSTWVVGEQIAEIIDSGETPDAATVLARMNQLDDFDTQGMTPPITTTQASNVVAPIPLDRLYNPTFVAFEIQDGNVVEVSGEFLNPFEEQ